MRPSDGLTVKQRRRRNYRRSETRQPTPADLEFLERAHRTLYYRGSPSGCKFWREALRRAGRARRWKGLRTVIDSGLSLAVIDPPLPEAKDPRL